MNVTMKKCARLAPLLGNTQVQWICLPLVELLLGLSDLLPPTLALLVSALPLAHPGHLLQGLWHDVFGHILQVLLLFHCVQRLVVSQ